MDDPEDLAAKAIDKVPFIVPPTSGKTAFFGNESVRAQWSLTAAALRGAAVVYVLGYSLTNTDDTMRLMLRTIRPPRVVVVDLDCKVAKRFSAIAANVEHIGGTKAICDFVRSLTNG